MAKVTVGSFLEGLPICADLMPPLAHTTMGTHLHDIIYDGKFKVSDCTVFGVPSLYFFVGRPAYRANDIKNAQFWHLPCVFLCKPPKSTYPASIYPFDTGGYKAEFLGTEIAGISLENFAIPLSYESISQYICAFFETKKGYIDGKPLSDEVIKKKHNLNNNAFTIFALSKFMGASGSNSDERRLTVEVRYQSDIEISDIEIELAIIPESWQDDIDLNASLIKIAKNVEYYPIFPSSSNAYIAKIYELCDSYCK